MYMHTCIIILAGICHQVLDIYQESGKDTSDDQVRLSDTFSSLHT